MSALSRPVLLLVEDDAVFRGTLARALEARGFDVVEAGGIGEGAELAALRRPEVAVLDLRLPDGSGLKLLADLKVRLPELRAVILTGWGAIATAMEAVRLGAVDFLAKPVDADRIAAVLRATNEPARPLDEQASRDIPSLDRVEWEHIQRVLVECDGNVSRAARLLGLHRRSLQRKLGKRPAAR